MSDTLPIKKVETSVRDLAKKPVIVLVGGDTATIDRAAALGPDVFLIQKPEKLDPATARNTLGTLVLDYENVPYLADFVRVLQKDREVLCVVSLTEFGLLPAARLNEALGLPGVSSQAVVRTRDKGEMRRLLATLSPVAARLVETSAEAAAFGAAYGWPIILKPIDGVGSRSVRRIDHPADPGLEPWLGGQVLAEKYVEGRLISVEAFSFNGRHVIYGINEEFPMGEAGPPGCNPHVETAHQIPAALEPAQSEEIARFVPKVLDTLGIEQGPTHTEVILTSNGLHLLETHTRPGGDFIPEMLQRCIGIDLLSLSLAWSTGLTQIPAPVEQWPRGAALRFFTPPPGRVRHVSGLEACRDMPGISAIQLDLKPGDLISPLLWSDDRVGYVMAVCSTSAEAAEQCRKVIEAVKIEVDPA